MEQSQQQVILIGEIGCGKTTIFNKACNQNEKVTPGGVSVTRSVFLTESAYGRGFRLLDTPGIGTFSDRMDHACGIAKALGEGDVHQIIVCVKFERLDLMRRVMMDFICKKLYRFRDLITVAVTHFDLALTCLETKKLSNEEQQKLKNQRKDEAMKLIQNFNVNSGIFLSEEDTGQQICEQIDQILEKNQFGRKCILSKTELESYFNLIDETDAVYMKLNAVKAEIILRFRKICRSAKIFIDTFDPNHKLLVDIMHALTLAIKDKAKEFIEQYEKEHQQDFNELYEDQQEEVIYFIHAQVKAGLVDQIDAVQKAAQKKMYVCSNYGKEVLKVNDFIKQCPHCGLFWLKVSGCQGTTQCGDYPTSDSDQIFASNQQLRRFTFEFTEKQVTCSENQSYLQIVYEQQQYKKSIDQVLLKGCRKSFVWSSQPALSELKMQELCETGVLDYLAKLSANYEKKEKSLSEKIDNSLAKMKITQLVSKRN